jgi:hypothetical protein
MLVEIKAFPGVRQIFFLAPKSPKWGFSKLLFYWLPLGNGGGKFEWVQFVVHPFHVIRYCS